MADNHTQLRISKEDMEKLQNSAQSPKKDDDNNNQEKPKANKPKLKTSTLILRVALGVVTGVYILTLIYGQSESVLGS